MAIFTSNFIIGGQNMTVGNGNYFNYVLIANQLGSQQTIHVHSISFVSGGVAATTTAGIIGLFRCSIPTTWYPEGTIYSKVPWDSNTVSDNDVVILGFTNHGIPLGAGTPSGFTSVPLSPTLTGGSATSVMSPRLHTAAGMVCYGFSDILPDMGGNTNDIFLHPGEGLLVAISPVSTAAPFTSAVSSTPNFNIVWEEVNTPSYTISGNITLSGSPVTGAEVSVIVADDTSFSNAYYQGLYTSNSTGGWSASIPTGKTAYAYAQNYTGGVYYTANGAPFIT